MEKNKYYTPTIEEFHVGSEYEPLQLSIWKSVTIKDAMDVHQAVDNTKRNPLQSIVKYLDKEDIEDCGCIRDKMRCVGPDVFVGWSSNREFYIEFNRMQLQPGDIPLLEISHIDNANKIKSTIFQGAIKNKSEFKTLMKWLQII